MTRDDIIQMAREAQEVSFGAGSNIWVFSTEGLEHFAAFVAATEREGCAREVYKVLRTIQVADQAATAIRARGK
jgi:hypothetical protein